MEGSGLKVYVIAACGRLNDIFNSKSWVKALRSYNNVASSHLKRFLSRGPKSFEPIEEYLDTAWAHPQVLAEYTTSSYPLFSSTSLSMLNERENTTSSISWWNAR